MMRVASNDLTLLVVGCLLFLETTDAYLHDQHLSISARTRQRRTSLPLGTTASLATTEGECNHDDSNSKDAVSRRTVFQRAAGAVAATSSGLLLPGVEGVHAAATAATRENSSTTAATTTTTTVPMIRLGKSTLEVSRTIQGYWQLAGGHGRYKEADAIDNMKAHADAGITTLDTADIYGVSELIVGKFIGSQQQQSMQSSTIVPCTKFCCFRFLDEINRDEVKQRIQRACERLQVSRLPLVQFFWSNYDVKR